MNILVVEPFYTESHKQWLDGLIASSSNNVTKLILPGFHWKWRMHGAAVTLAEQFQKKRLRPDLVICTDMLDLSVFTSLLRKELFNIPVVLYFHENQLTYPWSPNDQDVELNRDRHYAFINYTSALTADFVLFNSPYHQKSFISGLDKFLKEFPDFKNVNTIQKINAKSEVLPLGLDLSKFDPFKKQQVNKEPIILWNHRWEYDKNPESFFNALFEVKKKKLSFKLIVLGKSYSDAPKIFKLVKEKLADEIIHWGYVKTHAEYARLLCRADYLPVTSYQDFFGISVAEAMYCGAIPLLPNRLAYPMHLDDQSFFYQNESEFLEKLVDMVGMHPFQKKIDLKKINSYDWSQQILAYDATFSKLSANFAKNRFT
jgi:glycosyltransferase involved in cell wall biosynthesis